MAGTTSVSPSSTFPKTTVQLFRAERHHASVFRLKDAAHLHQGMGHKSHLENPETGESVPVPYGNLKNYANHFIEEWGDPEAYVALLFVTQYCESTSVPEPDLDAIARDIQMQLASLSIEEQTKIQFSLAQSVDTPQKDEDTPATGC